MEMIELSYKIRKDSPKWPTNPEEEIIYEQCREWGDACNASTVQHHLHNGTHVDAPKHFCSVGKTIDEIPIEDFYYQHPYVWNLQKAKGECITKRDILENEKDFQTADIILIYTGYSMLRENMPEDYIRGFPYISGEAAEYLRQHFPKLKAIALDVLSADDGITGCEKGFPAHHALLDSLNSGKRTLLIYEDVNVGKVLNKKISQICAFPIRFYGLEAAPVSIVAFIKKERGR